MQTKQSKFALFILAILLVCGCDKLNTIYGGEDITDSFLNPGEMLIDNNVNIAGCWAFVYSLEDLDDFYREYAGDIILSNFAPDSYYSEQGQFYRISPAGNVSYYSVETTLKVGRCFMRPVIEFDKNNIMHYSFGEFVRERDKNGNFIDGTPAQTMLEMVYKNWLINEEDSDESWTWLNEDDNTMGIVWDDGTVEYLRLENVDVDTYMLVGDQGYDTYVTYIKRIKGFVNSDIWDDYVYKK
jgi:hypothetical protein